MKHILLIWFGLFVISGLSHAGVESKAIDYAKELAEQKIASAKQSIDRIKDSITDESYDFFNELADYMVKRKI